MAWMDGSWYRFWCVFVPANCPNFAVVIDRGGVGPVEVVRAMLGRRLDRSGWLVVIGRRRQEDLYGYRCVYMVVYCVVRMGEYCY